MFFLKIFSIKSDRYSRVKHEWQIAKLWSAKAPHRASAGRELTQLKGCNARSDGPEGAACSSFVLLFLSPSCKASACALPKQALQPQRGSPSFPMGTPNYGRAAEDGGTTALPLMPAASQQPPGKGGEGKHVTRLCQKRSGHLQDSLPNVIASKLIGTWTPPAQRELQPIHLAMVLNLFHTPGIFLISISVPYL